MQDENRAQETLEESLAQFKDLYENAPNAFFSVGVDAVIHRCNRRAGELLGYAVEELVGRPVFDLYADTPQGKEKASELFQRFKAGEEIHDAELQMQKSDGALIWISLTVNAVRDAQGQVVESRSMIVDITERKRTEERIHRERKTLALVNALNHAANRGDSLHEIIDLFDRRARDIFAVNDATVYLFSQDKEYLVLQNLTLPINLVRRIEKLIGRNIPKVRIRLSAGSVYAEILRAGKPRITDDPAMIRQMMAECTENKALQKLVPAISRILNYRSVMSVPLVVGGEAIGLVDMSRREAFSEPDLEHLAVVAEQFTAILRRKQAEEELHRSLEETAHSQRLLLALSRAAQAVQRARTPEAVYRAIGEQTIGLGFDATVFNLSDDRAHLIVSHITLKSELVRAAEKLTGLSAEGYRFPLTPDGYFQRIVAGGETVFSYLDSVPFAEALPRPAQPLAARLAGLFGWKQSIIAPLIVGSEVQGLLVVTGTDLTESDMPAVTAFANQAAIAIENARLYKETQQLAAFNESIIQSMAEGIVVEDIEGYFIYVNPAAATMLGYTPDELVGLRGMAITQPDQQPIVQAANERRMRGESDRYELELVHKDGGRINVLIAGSPRLDAEGRFVGTMAVFTDITDRVRAEEALRASEARYRMLMDSANDAIFIADAETGMLLDANRSAQQMIGRSLDEIRQMHQSALHPPEEREHYETIFREYIMAGSAVAQSLYVVNRDGDYIPVEVSANAIEIKGRRFIQGIFRDVTERVRAEEALRASEDRYRAVIQAQTALIYRYLSDGTITFANDAYCQFYGRPLDEIVGTNQFDMIPAEAQNAVRKHIASLSAENPVVTNENININVHGESRWFHWTDQVILNADGDIAEYQAVGRDITDRVRAEEERERLLAQIRAQAKRIQQTIDTVPEGVILLDAAHRVMLANTVAEGDLVALAGVRVGDIITRLGDRPLAELLTSPPTKGLWHEVKADGRTFEVIARPMENGPVPENWVLVIRDVTQEREVQHRLRQQERLAAVGQLAAGIAHDFNNIMSVIVLYTYMALREGLPPKTHERLETVSRQAYMATELIQQILDFSRRAVLERRPMDLTPFLKEVVNLLERTVPENIRISLNYGMDEYTVNADPTRMQQALMNLALNARDAMPQGGKLRIELDRLRVESCQEPPLPEMEAGEWVRVRVTDTGNGIPPDVLPHIFEPFFTTKEVGKGTGLGLAQVYGIVKQHEGHIDVSTKMGEGTTFTIYLPVLQVQKVEQPSVAVKDAPQGQGEMVLVVEDDAALREALADILELLDYRVLEAANGREALDILEARAGEVALVLSDLVMPEMGGQALFHAMRQRGLTLPVVMLSGHPMENELKGLQEQGLAGWMLKPPNMEQLARLLARVMGGESE